jgi:hypothetical protein
MAATIVLDERRSVGEIKTSDRRQAGRLGSLDRTDSQPLSRRNLALGLIRVTSWGAVGAGILALLSVVPIPLLFLVVALLLPALLPFGLLAMAILALLEDPDGESSRGER